MIARADKAACVDHLRYSVFRITGGSVYSEHGAGVNMDQGQLEISGGVVTAANGSAAIRKADGIKAVVTGGAFSSDVSACVAQGYVPAKEMAQPVEVKVAADASVMGNKKVSVVYAYDETVSVIEPTSADVNSGSVTFGADKFSSYAILATDQTASCQLADYTVDGKRVPIVNAKFGLSEDCAFAGWFHDAAFTQPYDSTETSGTAYPKFVKIDTLIAFKGGSLRMDFTKADGTSDYSKTSSCRDEGEWK